MQIKKVHRVTHVAHKKLRIVELENVPNVIRHYITVLVVVLVMLNVLIAYVIHAAQKTNIRRVY